MAGEAITRQQLSLPAFILNQIPTSTLIDCQALVEHTRTSLAIPIFNHSLRVYLLALRILLQQDNSDSIGFHNSLNSKTKVSVSKDALFAACMFHDMGTCSACNGPQRFEVEGADAAVRYLCSSGLENTEALHQIWSAIALHTSAGIAERIHPFTYLVRMAVKADFSPAVRDGFGLKDFASEIETNLPRLGIEQCLAAAVVGQATRGEIEQGLYASGGSRHWTDSGKFPKASWPGVLLRGHLEMTEEQGSDWKGLNPAF